MGSLRVTQCVRRQNPRLRVMRGKGVDPPVVELMGKVLHPWRGLLGWEGVGGWTTGRVGWGLALRAAYNTPSIFHIHTFTQALLRAAT